MAPSTNGSGDVRVARPLVSLSRGSEAVPGEAPVGSGGTQPSPFQITTPSSTVSLDSNNQGIVSFTVVNASGRALRASATPRGVDPDPTRPGWPTLQVDGQPEFDFPIGGTQQYRVRIQANPGTAGGKYTFRLDVSAVGNPDEVYTHGSSVAFQVTPARPPFPWLTVALIALGVLVIGAIAAFVLLRNVAVPDVRGQLRADARATLEAGGLAVGIVTTRPTGATP